MKPRTVRTPSSNASHGLRSRHGDPPGALSRPPTMRSATRARAPPGGSTGECVEERQPQGRRDGRSAKVALDPLEDDAERDELPRRVQVEQGVDEAVRTIREREPHAEPGARLGRFADAQGALDVARVERRLALLAAAELVPAHDAAIVLAGRTGLAAGRIDEHRRGQRRRAAPGRRRAAVPDDLVEHDGPAAGRAAAGVELADRRAEAGFAARRRGEGLDAGVEVAEVGRAQDDLGEEAVEGASSPG